MQHYQRHGLSFMGALGITAFLFLLLLIIDSIRYHPLEEPSRRGSVKLSQHTKSPTQEQNVEAEDMPEVAELEHVAQVDMALETPSVQPTLPSMKFDFAPEVVGTVPVAGVPSVSSSSAPPAMTGGALSLGDVDELPRPIYAPPPGYPSRAKKREKVTVRVRILLGTNGKVVRISPVNMPAEHQVFLQEIQNSVSRWEFTPCKKAGKAVQCIAEQPFVFNPR